MRIITAIRLTRIIFPGWLFASCITAFVQAANLISVEPAQDASNLLHNPDMGWVLYENYPLDQEPNGSSTLVTLPNDSFPEVDTVAVMFSWRDVETAKDVYDFSKVDFAYDYWSKRGKSIQLRMSSEPLLMGTPKDPNAGGGAPDYLLVQIGERDKQTRRMENRAYMVVDSRNRCFRERLIRFLSAVNRHFGAQRPVNLIDLRGFGLWGEWHSGFKYDDLKTRRDALKGILKIWSKAFSNRTLALSFSYDPDSPAELRSGSTKKFEASQTAHYEDFLRYSAFDLALKVKNITFRRDGCGGAVHSNERRLNEEAFSTYRRAPMSAEFLGGYGSVKQGGSNWVSWMVEDALSLHPNYINLLGWQAQDARDFANERSDLVALGSLRMGYRFVPTQVEYPERIATGEHFQFHCSWTNQAVGRALRDYQQTLLLVDTAGNKVAESNARALPTSRWVNGSGYNTVQRFSFPEHIPAGSYRLALALRDPATRKTISLPLKERGPGESYLIGPIRAQGR